MFRRFLLAAVASSPLLMFAGIAEAAEPSVAPVVLSMRADSQAGKLGTALLTEAYRRIGFIIEVRGFPGTRAIVEANRGNTDGEVVRLKRVLKDYRNLLIIPEPLMYVETTVASKDKTVRVDGWETVNRYPATTVRGYKSIERRLNGPEKFIANSIQSALKMLQYDRVKILVLSNLDLQIALKDPAFSDIFVIQPPISRVPLYHLLHKSREPLVSRLSAVLKAMKSDGTHDRIVADYIKEN